MNSPRKGFASVLLVIALVVIAGAAVWWTMKESNTSTTPETSWFSTSTEQSANTNVASRTYTDTKFEAVIPSSWKVVSSSNPNVDSVSFRSPDYALKSAEEANGSIGESINFLKQGAEISVFPQGNKVAGSWQDPAVYVQYHLDRKSSNSVSREISLDGQPALLSRVRADDGSLMSEWVVTVRDGHEVQITLGFADEASMDWAVWDTFLSSFKFL